MIASPTLKDLIQLRTIDCQTKSKYIVHDAERKDKLPSAEGYRRLRSWKLLGPMFLHVAFWPKMLRKMQYIAYLSLRTEPAVLE